MSLPVWGNLQKSQVDPEKIEEAIARLIQAHEDDPTAHVMAGESLESHRAAAIIDHVVASIIADKIKDGEIAQRKLRDDSYFIFTAFESLDGWEKDIDAGGAAVAGLLATSLYTGNVANKTAQIRAFSFSGSGVVNFGKNPFFQTSLKFNSDTTQEAHFGSGDYDPGVEESKWFGFDIVDGTLYAASIEAGVRGRTEITGIDFTAVHVYRADYNSAENEIYYFVDGVLKATRTTNLPTGIWDPVFGYYIKTTAAAERWVLLQDLLWSQEK